MTLPEIDRATRPALISFQTVAKIFGNSLSATYNAADRGELDEIEFGGRRWAKTAPIRQKFGLPPVVEDASPEQQAA